MAKSHPADERKRLADYYASLTEGELAQLADCAWSLTDMARPLLKAEISARGLTLELRDKPELDAHAADEFVTLRVFRDIPEALLAKSILDSAEIECFLNDENLIRIDWFLSNLLGGVKLLAKKEDVQDALQLLDSQPQESFKVSEDIEYDQPRCTRCDSLNIAFGERGKRLAYATVAAGIPLPITRGGWKCHACGHHQWEEGEFPPHESDQHPD